MRYLFLLRLHSARSRIIDFFTFPHFRKYLDLIFVDNSHLLKILQLNKIILNWFSKPLLNFSLIIDSAIISAIFAINDTFDFESLALKDILCWYFWEVFLSNFVGESGDVWMAILFVWVHLNINCIIILIYWVWLRFELSQLQSFYGQIIKYLKSLNIHFGCLLLCNHILQFLFNSFQFFFNGLSSSSNNPSFFLHHFINLLSNIKQFDSFTNLNHLTNLALNICMITRSQCWIFSPNIFQTFDHIEIDINIHIF